MSTAARLARLVAAHTQLELWAPPVTGVVNWRPASRDPSAVPNHLTGAWVSLTDIDGQQWFRSVTANPLADPAQVIDRITAAL